MNQTIENESLDLKYLYPTNEADNHEIYEKALTESLKNNRVANIAITGGYGSGKSSVIETFIRKKNESKDYNFLRISLANFNYDHGQNENIKSTKVAGVATDELNEQITLEISLLQQIIYQSDPEKSTQSRFNRIKDFPKKKLKTLTILIISTFIFFQVSWNPLLIMKWTSVDFAFKISESIIFHIISFFLLLITAYLVLKETLSILHKFKVSKIEFKSISLESKDQLSILNLYVDEIIYLFKTNEFNIVILEDIDRLYTHDLFTKLREINHLLRNSPDTKKLDVKFIYALRESIFSDESEKNKFFDITIPIIPIINNQNSKSILFTNFGIDPNSKKSTKLRDVLQTTSLCISDYRTINNIYNEFIIYKKYLLKDGNLAEYKLLAMIIYKNLFPIDYEKIHVGESVLQQLFETKEKLIGGTIEVYESKIEDINSQLLLIESEKMNSEEELRKSYISELYSLETGDIRFFFNSKPVYFKDLILEVNFNNFYSNGINFRHQTNGGNRLIQFQEIEKKINKNQTYHQRLNTIKNKNHSSISLLNKNKEELRTQIRTISNKSFSFFDMENAELELLKQLNKYISNTNEARTEEKDGKLKNNSEIYKSVRLELVKAFLKQGYIQEDYRYYVSYIHNGALTVEDSQFVLKVLNNSLDSYKDKLDNVKNVFLELRSTSFDFNIPSYFNFELLNYILKNNETDNVIDSFVQILKLNKEIGYKFLPGFLIYCETPQNLIRKCTLIIDDFIQSYLNHPDITKEDKDLLIAIVLEYCVEDIVVSQNFDFLLSEYIESMENFTVIFNYKKTKINFKQILKNLIILNIEFEKNTLIGNNELQKLIYENNLYVINQSNIYWIIKYFKKIPITINSLFELKNSELIHLIKYVENNLNDFVENVIIIENIDENLSKESESTFLEILNNINVSPYNKELLISHIKHLNFELSQIEETDFWPVLLKNKHIKITSLNLINYFEFFGFDENLLAIINEAKWIKKIEDWDQFENADLEMRSNFISEILSINLNMESIDILLKNIQVEFNEDDIIESISSNFLNKLLEKKLFDFSLSVFKRLKTVPISSTEFFHLKFILQYQSEILEHWSEEFIEFTKLELQFILSNKGLNSDFAYHILDKIFIDLDTKYSEEEAEMIFHLILKCDKYTESIEFNSKMIKELSKVNQIKYFNFIYKKTPNNLNQLSYLIILFKDPLNGLFYPLFQRDILNNSDNMLLASNLMKLGLINKIKELDNGQIRLKRNSKILV